MRKSTHPIAISVPSVHSNSASQTQSIAKTFAKELLEAQPRKGAYVFALAGDLGSGKTTFVQGFAKGLGVKEKILSPTFILMKNFKIQSPKSKTNSKSKNTKYKIPDTRYLYHIDCYRLDSPAGELLRLGLKDIIQDPRNIVVVEWADRIKKILPKNSIWIHFKTTNKTQRELRIK